MAVMLIRREKLRDFCKGVVRLLQPYPSPPAPDALARGSGYFSEWRLIYLELAMLSMDLGFGPEIARDLLGMSARAGIQYQQYTPLSGAPDMLEVLFRIGTCHDAQAATAFCAAYLDTPEGRRGERSPRGFDSPGPDDHFWHFANALALFHTGDTAVLPAALDEMLSLPPRKWRKYSDPWFKAMTGLAIHCLTAPAPDPWELLAETAVVNAKMFAADIKDLHYDAWIAEKPLAFASAAQQRGWVVPDRDPHPSMPLALLRLPPMPVPDYPWSEPPAPDPGLVRAIERVAKGLPPRKEPAPARQAASGAAKKAATSRAHSKRVGAARSAKRGP
jgi:hypothetical protein